MSLSSLPHTEKNDDGYYFAYITDTGIVKDSLTLQKPKDAIEGMLDKNAVVEGLYPDQLLNKRFLWLDGSTVVESRDLAIGNPAYGNISVFPFTIKKDTIYKVEVTLGQDTDFADATQANMIIDFYAGPAYDRLEQQVSGFIWDGRYKYTYYFNSGDVGGEMLDGSVRMFTAGVPETLIPVDTLRVTEMEQVW